MTQLAIFIHAIINSIFPSIKHFFFADGSHRHHQLCYYRLTKQFNDSKDIGNIKELFERLLTQLID